jgi:hypothetical protein
MMILALAAVLADANLACARSAPTISGVTSRIDEASGGLNTYGLHVSIVNRGSQRQASNVLQSVSIFQDGSKVDQKGIPPLAGGGSYAFDYTFSRADGARPGTTSFAFALQPDRNADAACYGASPYRLRV